MCRRSLQFSDEIRSPLGILGCSDLRFKVLFADSEEIFGGLIGQGAASRYVLGEMLPQIETRVPGEESMKLGKRLGKVECRNTTFLADDWPIFWERAEGVNVWDVDGNRFLDLTSGFGVAGLGYGFTGGALRKQSEVLMHAMGDVHPARVKVELCELLSEMTFGRWTGGAGRCLFGNSGFEAVEAALKTAVLATGRSGLVSFEGGYHGLGYGALLGAGISWFREPFEGQLAKVTSRLPFPRAGQGLEVFRDALARVDGSTIAAVVVEPFQGRGGIVVPELGFLKMLRQWCDNVGAILILDEIYTGFWRTGELFACEHDGVVPDLVCLGKGLSGGFPISVCVGSVEVMDAWPASGGEALHTSTFLGNPMGCAMAIDALRRYLELETAQIVERAGRYFRDKLDALSNLPMVQDVRGRGLMLGVELESGKLALEVVKELLQDGIIVLPDAPGGEVVAMTPPFCISEEEIDFVVDALSMRLRQR